MAKQTWSRTTRWTVELTVHPVGDVTHPVWVTLRGDNGRFYEMFCADMDEAAARIGAAICAAAVGIGDPL